MNKTRLKKYASLIVRIGVNVQKGQTVVVRAELDQPEFVKMVVEEAYKAGAKKVEIEWDYQPLQKLHVKYRSLKTLSTVEKWEQEKLKLRSETLPCMIYLISEDPDGLNGINRTKMAKYSQERYKIIKPYRDAMDNKYQWCIAAVAGAKWAKKMFPNERVSKATELLWEAILETSRVNENPIEAWNKHNADLKARCDYLNSINIEKLHYKSENGTDLTVGMIPQAMFLGGIEKSLMGNYFNPNIPSEEVFITPKKGDAEGIVYATKPLCYRGELIDNFWIKFHEGKAVEFNAEKNGELLKTMIEMDEGAAYLGECALVPYNSPIRNIDLLFYNTLFDENAACHLALGEGFTNTIKDFENYTLDECRNMGVNDSMIHEDFMIGSKDMQILAITKDGKEIKIFENGNWAF